MRYASRTDRTSLQRSRRTLFCLLSLPCSALLVTIACAAIMLAWKPPDRRTSITETPCCEEQVALLSGVVNLTINPCKSAQEFLCDGYNAKTAPGALFGAPDLTSDWGYKPSNTPAGKLAYKYYRSCVTAMVHGERLGALTASTLLAYLGPIVKSPVRLIAEISLKYFIDLPVSFVSENMYLSRAYPFPYREFFNVYHIAVTLTSVHKPWRSKQLENIYHGIRNDARQSINDALILNVSQDEVKDIHNAFKKAPSPTFTASNLTALYNLIPALTIGEWRSLLENCTGSKITGVVFLPSNYAVLKSWLDILLEPTAKAKSVVFLLVEATSRLLIGSVTDKGNIMRAQEYFRHCEVSSAAIVTPLLIRNKLETLNAGKLQDAMLKSYFRSITEAVGERAANLVAPEDANYARKFPNDTSLLLPSDIYSLDFKLPILTNDYVRNYLLMRDSGWTLYNIPMPGDVPRILIMRIPFQLQPEVYKNIVILSLNAYMAVNITSTIDAVVPYGIIGMSMADAVWRIIWELNWSKGTRKRLNDHDFCILEQQRIHPQMRFYYPTLSLDATLDAARREHWHSKFRLYAYQLRETSRSQLFFLLILFHYYCPESYEKSLTNRLTEANYLMHRSDDFREAFHCTDRPVSADVSEC